MAFISVDRARLDRAAAAVENYVKNHKNKMSGAHSEIDALSRTWQGTDFNQFRTRWNRVTERDSTSGKMLTAMENYARFLRNASKRYGDAQTSAINRARSI